MLLSWLCPGAHRSADEGWQGRGDKGRASDLQSEIENDSPKKLFILILIQDIKKCL